MTKPRIGAITRGFLSRVTMVFFSALATLGSSCSENSLMARVIANRKQIVMIMVKTTGVVDSGPNTRPHKGSPIYPVLLYEMVTQLILRSLRWTDFFCHKR